jgi:two-component system response regulator
MLDATLMLPIVVIDDSREDLLLVERVIRQSRVLNPVRLFRDSVHSHAYFSDASAGSEPALMFVDLLMFPKSGIDVVRSLKRYPRARASLTVMLTGLGDVRHIQQGYDAGATTFLIKPFSVDDFRNFLRAFSAYFSVNESSEGRMLAWSDVFRAHQKETLGTVQNPDEQPRADVNGIIPKPPQ